MTPLRSTPLARGERASTFNEGLRTSETPEWSTPSAFFAQLEAQYGPFTLDPCATPENAKCERFFTIEDDGLTRSWAGETVFMNPPYGRAVRRWMRKALSESKRGAKVVCLVPARTDAGWWHDYAMKGEVTFIRGRLRFSGSQVNAPVPSAVGVVS